MTFHSRDSGVQRVRSNWSKTEFSRNAVKWWFLYVIWCVESIGERILAIRPLLPEISSYKVDFFANPFTCILMDSVIEMVHDCLFFPMYFDELNLMVKKF